MNAKLETIKRDRINIDAQIFDDKCAEVGALGADNNALRSALQRAVDQLEMLRRGDDWAPNSTAHAIDTARAALARSA